MFAGAASAMPAAGYALKPQGLGQKAGPLKKLRHDKVLLSIVDTWNTVATATLLFFIFIFIKVRLVARG